MKKYSLAELDFGKSDLIKEEFLRPDELFLLEFLKGFNRKISRRWVESGKFESH